MQLNHDFAQGDRETITELLERNGEPIDLTDRTVTFVLRHHRLGRIDLQNAVKYVTDGSDGQVRITLESEDLGRHGDHFAKWRITGGEDDPTSLPRDRRIFVDVEKSLSMVGRVADRISFSVLSDLSGPNDGARGRHDQPGR